MAWLDSVQEGVVAQIGRMGAGTIWSQVLLSILVEPLLFTLGAIAGFLLTIRASVVLVRKLMISRQYIRWVASAHDPVYLFMTYHCKCSANLRR